MDKNEVQKRVLLNGKPLYLHDFSWDEKTKTFSSDKDRLVLDFYNITNCTFDTGSECTFKTGSECTFKTGSECTFARILAHSVHLRLARSARLILAGAAHSDKELYV